MYTIHGLGRAIQHRIDLWGPEGHHKTLGLSNEMPLASALQNRPLMQCLSVTSAARSGLCIDGRLLPFRPGRVFLRRPSIPNWSGGTGDELTQGNGGYILELWDDGCRIGDDVRRLRRDLGRIEPRNKTLSSPACFNLNRLAQPHLHCTSHAAAASRDIETLHT